MLQRHFGHEPLKAQPTFNTATTHTEVIVDDFNPLPRPAQQFRSINQLILQTRRLGILFDSAC
jgi:hypothetical protein